MSDPGGEQRMEAALKPFGWTCGPEFWQRYYSDPWVFNLANAVERLTAATSRPIYKPRWHMTHACISCSVDGVTPGPGCINCRNTGYDQTPCPSCSALTDATLLDESRPLIPDSTP